MGWIYGNHRVFGGLLLACVAAPATAAVLPVARADGLGAAGEGGVRARLGGGVGMTLGHSRRWSMAVAGALVALMVATPGCSSRPSAPAAGTPYPTSAPTAVDIASACRHPNAIASTNRHFQVGKPGAPTVGPLSFHPYPYRARYPTKMIIHAVQDLTQPVVMRGFRCADARVLRFYYNRDALYLPTPPFTEQQLQENLGDPVANLKPMPAGADDLGYALFSSDGQWLVTLAHGNAIFGVLRIDVEPAR